MGEFRHIARACGLRPEWRGSEHYFRGRGHRWRINDCGEFQMCDGNFDRWANSVGVSIPLPPENRRQLLSTIHAMRAALKDKEYP
jgi:hypothetical protein